MLGQKIKEQRKLKRISCSELARRTKHPFTTIHGIESGANKNPSFQTIKDISNELNISLDELGKV